MSVVFNFVRSLAFVFPMVLLGCADTGYYNDSLARIDQTPRRIPAAIQVSAPQIYKREALINERRDERSYLLQKLKESETLVFSPELIRDIEVVSVLAAQLGLSFDAGIKRQAEQTTELNDLANQISVLKLQAQLGQLQRDLQLMQAAYPSQTAPSAPAGTTAATTALPTLSAPNLPDVKNLVALMQSLTERLDKASVGPRSINASSSPVDVFQDRQAYRRVLQGALNAASLDDLHDFEGNSLFRMQFKATVLPGAQTADRSLGVLRMQIKPPSLAIDDEVVTSLYNEWLDHISLRLNEGVSEEGSTTDPVLLTLGSMNELFSVVTVTAPKAGKEKSCKSEMTLDAPVGVLDPACFLIRIAVPPVQGARKTGSDIVALNRYSSVADLSKQLETRSNNLSEILGSIKLDRPAGEALSAEATEACKKAQREIGVKDALFAHTLALQRGLVVSSDRLKLYTSHLASTMASFSAIGLSSVYQLVDQYTRQARVLEEACSIKRPSSEATVPIGFYGALFNVAPQAPQGGQPITAKGKPSAYAVTPVELAQHVSTAARASSAIQMAASLAAILPVKGIGANGALGYSRAATGRADALERVPLVVGYAEPADQEPGGRKGMEGFGWILGPRVVLDSQNKALSLEHTLSPYDLAADVVMPGWWPYFDIEYQSEWAPDWQVGVGQFADSVGPADTASQLGARQITRTLRVQRRHSRADLDGIVTLVLKRLGSPRVELASIGRVEPSVVSGCAKEVTLLVQGSNIWRTEAAYLEGMPASSITVMPDMAGVAVKFDMSQLPQRPSQYVQPKLTLATPNGWPTYGITIDGSRLAAKPCGDEGLGNSPADDGSPVITSVLPATLYSCDAALRLLVSGKHLEGIQAAYLGTIPVQAKPVGKDLEVTLARAIGDTGGSQMNIPLIITTAKGTASKDLAIERDVCSANPANKGRPAGVARSQPSIQLTLLPIPSGRMNVCSKQSTLLVTGRDATKVDGATITLTKPKPVTINAQSVKAVQGQNVAEINFVGLPLQNPADSGSVDATVQVQLYRGGAKGALFNVEAVCGEATAAASK